MTVFTPTRRPRRRRLQAARPEGRGGPTQAACLYKPCSATEGYENEWAVPWYAAFTGQGHNGKFCEARAAAAGGESPRSSPFEGVYDRPKPVRRRGAQDPALLCFAWCPFASHYLWLRNNVRRPPGRSPT